MKSRGFVSCCGLIVLLIFSFRVLAAEAQDRYHPWKAGISAGPSFLTQDAASIGNTTGKIGPIIDAVVVYEANKYLSLGFDVEYQQNQIEQGSLTLGDASTFSFLARFELHLEKTKPVSPYFLLASGYNFNYFREDDTYLASCGEGCRIDIDNTLTIKVGFGLDMFLLSDTTAINVEVAWKYNKADMDFITGGNEIASDAFDGSSLGLFFGFRYYFPVSPFD
jgi:hypothetical protein